MKLLMTGVYRQARFQNNNIIIIEYVLRLLSVDLIERRTTYGLPVMQL